jgi:hypothetical protein
MSIDDIFRLGDRTIAEREEIERLKAINLELVEKKYQLLEEIDRLSALIESNHDIIWQQGAEMLELRNSNAELVEALKCLVADVDEYERVNNLSPNPGKLECWQSMAIARTALAKAKTNA